MTDENTLADLLAFVLAGRPERLTQAAVAQMPREQRAAVGKVAEGIAALASAEEPVEPSEGLRARIVASTQARLARRPRRALLVCDMLVDHLTPGRPLEVPRARAIVPAVARRIDAARAEGLPIVYVLDQHEADDPELDEWGAHALAGTEGAEVWPPLAPKPGDKIVTKPTYSSFFASRLEEVLDELAVDTLVMTGCATEVQLLTTATDALQRGFDVELPAETQAGYSDAGERFAMGVLAALVPYAPARKVRLERIAAQAT
ncbi:MAG TPA: isochorismatase family cysteine hydrolase [Polyangiaceae bacterium]|jgi:nicotinamidase-related amidase